MKRYFITGTDTDCGKTYVTAQLVNSFDHAAAIKPVASGCMVTDNQLVSADALKLQQFSDLPLDIINPWRFKSPVSPHIASREQNYNLSVNEIADYCLNLQSPEIDTLFIEGAGGLMVPLNEHETWIDFLHYSKIPVIIVVGMTLGCINHTLLTATALEVNNLKCAGWIANCMDPQMLALQENIDTLKRMLKIPLLGTVPYSGALTDIKHTLS